jgi:uncharacterized protein YlxW (UPF0749 family)
MGLNALHRLTLSSRPLPTCSVWTAPREAKTTVLAEAVAVKQRHAEALRQALQQIDQENSELQRQYAEQVASLQDASSTIASCMASFQQASSIALLAHDSPWILRMLVAALEFSDSHGHALSAPFVQTAAACEQWRSECS